MSILDLFRAWKKFGNRSNRARKRNTVSKVEALEVRQMLTVTLMGTVLQVDGTAAADTISVTQNGSGTTIVINGTTTSYGSGTTINTINVSALGGSDQIAIQSLLNTTALNVDGGTGTNTLSSLNPVQASTWVINGMNSGTLNGGNFTNIQNLTGGSANDDFVFQPTGFIQGAIDGGGGLNALDYSNLNAGATVNLQNSTATNIGGGFSNISITDFHGSYDTTDTLIAANGTNVWTIDGVNSGNINGQFYFTGVENLTGGTGDDTFQFYNGGSVQGTVKGGLGNNTLDYSNLSSGIVANLQANLATAIGTSFDQIQKIIGVGDGTDVLIANDYVNTWNITGVDTGSVTSAFTSMNYQNIANLTGGSQSDRYVFKNNGLVTGQINGAGGNNILDFSQRSDAINVDLSTDTATPMFGGFSSIQSLVGNSLATTNLLGSDFNNIWTLTAGNAGSVTNGVESFTFAGFQNLVGGDNNDTFAFGASGFVGGKITGGTGTNTLDYSARTAGIQADLQLNTATAVGGGFTQISKIVGANHGDDLLIGNNANNSWKINNNSGNAGVVTWGSANVTFSGIGNLRGGTGADSFAFSSGGFLTGSVSGAAGNNTLDYSAISGPITLNLQTGTSTAIGQTFSLIQNLIGGSGSGDTLIGPNVNSTWTITGANSGNVNGTFNFSAVENLTGGTQNDTFKMAPGGFIGGSINGGAGSNTLDYSLATSGVVVNLQTSGSTGVGGGVTSVQKIIGSSTANDTLVGANTTNTWNITGGDSGNINGTVSFSGFENLTGGSLTDSFVFATGGFVRGNILGGAGSNTLDYSNLTSGIQANLQASTSTNIGGVFGAIGTIAGANRDDVLIGNNFNNVWNINNNNQVNGAIGNAGTVSSTSPATSINFRGIANLVGGTGNDTFKFSAGGFVLGTVNGRGGANTLDYSSLTTPVTVNLQNNTASSIGQTFASIQAYIGNNAAFDKLIGTDTINTWSITGTNTGTFNSTFSFSQVANLVGGQLTDTFSLANGGSITGKLDGGTSLTSGDWIDYSAVTSAVTANLATGVLMNINQIANIQNVHGSNTAINTLTGNSSGNALVGGDANDTITAGSGNSVIIGGKGQDTVRGGSGQDIVISSYTNYDNNLLALNSILGEWQSANSFQVRVSHLRTGGGINKTNVLIADQTVNNDGVPDLIYGGAGPNWLWGQPAEFKDKTAADISDTPIDTAPTLSGQTPAIYTIGLSPIPVSPGIVVTDIDSATLSYATVKLTSNYLKNQDNLNFSKSAATGNIVGTFDSNTGILTLSSANATATVAQFQAALRGVSYSNASAGAGVPLSTLTRGIEIMVNDGLRSSATVLSSVSFNVAPTLSGSSTLTYATGQAATVINPNIVVGDVDNVRLASATVSISTYYNSNQDRLTFVPSAATGDIVGTFNVATGIMTLTSASNIQATVAQYQAALRSIYYQNIAAGPFKTQRVVTYQVFDGAANSNKVTSSIVFS